MLTKIILFNKARLQNTSRSGPGLQLSPLNHGPCHELFLAHSWNHDCGAPAGRGPALLTLLNKSDLGPKSGETWWFDPVPLQLDQQQENPDPPSSLDLTADGLCIPDLEISIKPRFQTVASCRRYFHLEAKFRAVI